MSVQRGDVVMIDWPYSDRTGSKVRPAVVVQVDPLNARIADTVLIAITGTTRRAGNVEVVIDPAVETGSGLWRASLASCNNLLTIDQGLIRRTLGSLSATTMQQIDAGLKSALGLT